MRTSGLVICNESYLFILYRTQLLWMLFFTLFQCQFLLPLKGQCDEMDIFLRSKHFNQYFLYMRWWFSRAFNGFQKLFVSLNFLIASLKVGTNEKWGGSLRWQMIRVYLGLWWSMSYCLLFWPPSCIKSVSSSAFSSPIIKRWPTD